MSKPVLLLSLACMCALAQAPPAQPQPELERLESLITELTALKSQVAAVEGRIETLLRGLSEQRGSLQNRPAFNALKNVETEGPADVKKAVVRCAALTGDGKRCSRAAVEGSRYCRQHQLAHQK